MGSQHYIGERLSYSGDCCTVRFIGEVKTTEGIWLGVEWDNPTRGKHSGEHDGVRYFECKSGQPKAGSFVRPTRAADRPLRFLEGLRQKYASDSESNKSFGEANGHIEISGKVVEEVGFEKIRKLLADLHELRIVLLDGLRLKGLLAERDASNDAVQRELSKIEDTCPNIQELDLSFNLVEDWQDIALICSVLKKLRSVKVIGNRFKTLGISEDLRSSSSFPRVNALSIDETLLSWLEICELSTQFPALTSLTASSNALTHIHGPVNLPNLTCLTLDSNSFTSLSALSPLTKLSSLKTLSLRLNSISAIYPSSLSTPVRPFAFPALTTLDLSRNSISTWSFISSLPLFIPHLTSLRTSTNPLYDTYTPDEAHILTLARLPPTLETLNFSTLSQRERENAELYYLSLIAKELIQVPEAREAHVLEQHPRWKELCEIYGAPTVRRKTGEGTGSVDRPPGALAHRLVEFTFYVAGNGNGSAVRLDYNEVAVKKLIPRTFDTYRVKGIVFRLFRAQQPSVMLKAMQFRLIWETEEYDPLSGVSPNEDESVDDPNGRVKDGRREKWVKRETELIDSTRAVGFWFDDTTKAVRVRIEPFDRWEEKR